MEAHHAAAAAEEPLGAETYLPDEQEARDADTTPSALTRAIEADARALGFARVGVASTAPLELARARLEVFRSRGYAADMQYLAAGGRHDPGALLPEARSVVVAALAHGDPELVPLRLHRSAPEGQIARYARGDDYHIVLKGLLVRLARRIATRLGRPVRARACVDTAPLLERELAVRAGLGFQGKSTLLIAPGVGSYVLLGELLLDVDLEPSTPHGGGCGACRACLDACPTQAFDDAYTLDARRCISYLTIEKEGSIPRELRAAIGNRVFGCDVCQEVCPYNASPHRPASSELGRRDALQAPELVPLLELGAAAYRRLVKRTALRRVSRTTLQRNAAVALGNSDAASAVAPLTRALRQGRDVVRAHAAWALGRLARHVDDGARAALAVARDHDPDPAVRDEARLALTEIEDAR